MRVLGNILPGDDISTLESDASACWPCRRTSDEGLTCPLSLHCKQDERISSCTWGVNINKKEIILTNVPPHNTMTKGDHGATGVEVSWGWDGGGGVLGNVKQMAEWWPSSSLPL